MEMITTHIVMSFYLSSLHASIHFERINEFTSDQSFSKSSYPYSFTTPSLDELLLGFGLCLVHVLCSKVDLFFSSVESHVFGFMLELLNVVGVIG